MSNQVYVGGVFIRGFILKVVYTESKKGSHLDRKNSAEKSELRAPFGRVLGGQNAPQDAPRRRLDGPRRRQDVPKTAKNRPKTPLRCVKMHPSGLKMQNCRNSENIEKPKEFQGFLRGLRGYIEAKMAPRRPKMVFCSTRNRPERGTQSHREPQRATKTLQDAPRCAQDAPKMPPRRPKTPQESENKAKIKPS